MLLLVVPAPTGKGQTPSADEDPPRHADDGGARPLEFIRVHVPNGRLADVPLGDERYVPMSAREFEDGMARLGAGDAWRADRGEPPPSAPLATAARYVIEPTADGGLEGSMEFDVGWSSAAGAVAGAAGAALARTWGTR
jgi:hypothetical protein